MASYTRAEIEEVHDTLTFLVKTISSQPEQKEWRQSVANFRKINVKYLDDANCFFVPSLEYIREVVGETYYSDLRLGFISSKGNSPLKERFIFPCKNIKKNVIGLVGYDNLSPSYKYLLTTTMGFDKSNITFGYEDLEYIYKCNYVIFVEGIMDYFRLKSLGYPVFCLQGVHLFDIHKRVFDRVPNKIVLLDSDKAGINAMSTLVKKFKYCTSVQMERNGLSKMDIDLFLSYNENTIYFEKVIEAIKNKWLYLDYTTVLLKNQSPELKDRMDKALRELKEKNKLKQEGENTNEPTNST